MKTSIWSTDVSGDLPHLLAVFLRHAKLSLKQNQEEGF